MKKFIVLAIISFLVLFLYGCSINSTNTPKLDDDNTLPETTTEYSITISEMRNGNVSVFQDTAQAGSSINVSVTPNLGYVLEEGSLKQNGNVIINYTFIMPSENVIITSNFTEEPKEEYEVTFNPKNGENILVSKTSVLTNFPEFELTGYEITGWYDTLDCTTEPYILPFVVTQNMSLYPKWEKVNYTISYYLPYGTNSEQNPLTYNIDTKTFILQAATAIGETFAGWYETEDFSKPPVAIISKGSAKNLVLYGKYLSSSDATPGLRYYLYGTTNTYGVSSGTANLSNGLIIPDYYNGLPVTVIGKMGEHLALNERQRIPFVKLPSQLRIISSHAFENSDLHGVTIQIPDTVESIQSTAFNTAHVGNIIINPTSNLKDIGSNAFANNEANYIYIPKGVTRLGSRFFASHAGVGTIALSSQIPQSVIDNFFYGSDEWKSTIGSYPAEIVYHNVIFVP